MNAFDIAGRHAVVVGAGGIGQAIALGLSPAARFVTGQILYVDGGLTARIQSLARRRMGT